MQRFYITNVGPGKTAEITDATQVHHLRDVLRLKAGDKIAIFDDSGVEYAGTIRALDRKHVEINIESAQPVETGGKPKLTIACSIPKKAKMDDIIDKLTQLGVDVIIPLATERGMVKIGEEDAARYTRWRKIALNAAEQSRRSQLPRISPVTSLPDLLTAVEDYDLKLIPTLTGVTRPLREVVTGTKAVNVLVLIGPEGDFSPAEVDLALAQGFIAVSLGQTVLRVETAAVAVASFIRLTYFSQSPI